MTKTTDEFIDSEISRFVSGSALLFIALLILGSGMRNASGQDQVPAEPLLVEDVVPLTTELPEAVFSSVKGGLLKAPNSERPEFRQPALMVPPGLINLAAGKPVSSSDDDPGIGRLEQITEGNKEARPDSFVELDGGLQWIQIDLELDAEIFGIWLWHFHSHHRGYVDVIVRLSNDPNFAKDVTEVYNADHDNSSGLGYGKDNAYTETNRGRVIDCKGIRARYVRLYSNGNSANEFNHYLEVEVWGRMP